MTVPVGAEGESDLRAGAVADVPHDPGSRLEPSPSGPSPSARGAVSGMCPYLTSSSGSWRSVSPSREHRCAAVDPPASQTNEKQRRHCLSRDHSECPVFRAARGARSATLAGGADPALVDAADRRRRPLARTAPILLESPRLIDQAMRLQFDRAPSQIALIALMIVAFAVVALTRLSSGAEPIGSASPEASIRAGSPSSTPMPTLAATPSVGPSMLPSASPASSFRTTYKVMKGDTLGGIAKTYGTTTAKIRTLNGLTSNTLKIGQVLKIP